MAVMVNDTDSPQAAPAARTILRDARSRAVTAATAVAAGRVALGLAALARPDVPARPWVGASADGLAAQVFGRALGGRDLALGLGALSALAAQRGRPRLGAPGTAGPGQPGAPGTAGAGQPGAPDTAGQATAAAQWLAAGALSDALDVAATLAAWPELPSRTRWLVAASAGGAALAGAAGALALLAGRS
jgi:hypothetical protein